MDFWTSILVGVITTVVSALVVKALERTFDGGRLKRVLLVAEGLIYFWAIPWFVAVVFFRTEDPAVGTRPGNAENILEGLAYIFYKGISPFGRLLIAAGVLTGLVLGIWYPEKLRELIDSMEGKQKAAGGTERQAKDADDRDGSA